MRQEDQKFKVILGCIEFEDYMRPCLKHPKKRRKGGRKRRKCDDDPNEHVWKTCIKILVIVIP